MARTSKGKPPEDLIEVVRHKELPSENKVVVDKAKVKNTPGSLEYTKRNLLTTINRCLDELKYDDAVKLGCLYLDFIRESS